jgi:IS30 family transposase
MSRVVVPDRVRRLVVLSRLDGRSCRLVAAEFGVSAVFVWRIAHDPDVVSQLYRSSPARLDLAAREVISRGLAAGQSVRSIAEHLNRHPSTVSREINRNGGCDGYRAYRAQAATCERARRPKPSRFDQNPVLAAVVEHWLEDCQWSPAQISARLRLEFPDDETMRVAPETIYQALYVHGRGGLRKELTAHLRSQRTVRRPQTVTARNRSLSPIPDLVSIAERPDEVEGRLVPGHWEGDLILGRGGHSQVATLVERTTGLVMLGQLDNKQAVTVADRLSERIQTLPEHLRRSLTWDRGTEMAAHAKLTIATGVKVYFCDPHAPWQRGSNENTNGLLRQYLPRQADLSTFSQQQLDEIADNLNNRPRQRHGFLTPLEVFDQLVLH